MGKLRYVEEQISGDGLRGELLVCRSLVAETPDDVIVIPWATVRNSNLAGLECDAIVVGPHAVFLVEVKDWHGRITGTFNDSHWTFRGHRSEVRRKSPIAGLEQRARIINGVVRDSRIPSASGLPTQEIVTFPDDADVRLTPASQRPSHAWRQPPPSSGTPPLPRTCAITARRTSRRSPPPR